MNNEKQKLIVIYQTNTLNYNDLNINMVRNIANRLLLSPIFLIVLPNNYASKYNCNNPIDVELLYHDNKSREFSAWESGLLYIKENLKFKAALFIFLNETFTRHHVIDNEFLQGIESPIRFIRNINKPFAIGDIDVIDCPPPYLNIYKCPYYLSTYFFILNYEAFIKIDTFVNLDLDKLFNNIPNKSSVFDRNSDFASTNYCKYLEEMFYLPSNRKFVWWGHSKLDFDNYNFLLLKCLSVILEHRLSQHLVDQGVSILDLKSFIFRSHYARFRNSIISRIRYFKKRFLVK